MKQEHIVYIVNGKEYYSTLFTRLDNYSYLPESIYCLSDNISLDNVKEKYIDTDITEKI